MKTRNWTQRIILKHLKREDVGMLTLSSFLNATAGGRRHIPDLLLLFVIVVLILVFIVLIVKALICAVDQSALILTKFNLGISCWITFSTRIYIYVGVANEIDYEEKDGDPNDDDWINVYS